VQVAIHTVGAPTSMIARVREVAHAVNPEIVIGTAVALSEMRQGDWYLVMGIAIGMVTLAGVLVALATSGLYAMLSLAVTERTREIGIRKAVGATRREILWQFLFEAVTLTVIGSGLGMAIGAGGAFIISALTPIPAAVPLLAIVAALSMATIAGVAFGMWPAWQAARMDPVVALRYE
jgi:putative ABC transport system permease protein